MSQFRIPNEFYPKATCKITVICLGEKERKEERLKNTENLRIGRQ